MGHEHLPVRADHQPTAPLSAHTPTHAQARWQASMAHRAPRTPLSAGARYHATLLVLAGEGLIDVAKCAAVKALFLGL